MQDSRNPVRLAIVAAGGNRAVSKRYGVSSAAVTKWWKNLSIPPRLIGEICEAGGGLVKAQQVRTYVVEHKVAKAAQQARDRFHEACGTESGV